MTADWHLDRILLSLNQESRDLVRVIRAGESLDILRKIFCNQLSRSAVRSGPGLDTGTPGWLRGTSGAGTELG